MPLIREFATLKRTPRAVLIAAVWLLLIHFAVLCADFFAPYDFTEQKRLFPFAPPTRIHFIDPEGGFHWRPFVCLSVPDSPAAGVPRAIYKDDCRQRFPIRLFVGGAPYRLGFLTLRLHLFGTDEPGAIHLMGTDGYGRDQFSRFLHGGRISLLGGVLACGLSLAISLFAGTIAGFYGGWIDNIFMWVADLFLALPWLYLLFAVRAFLPLDMKPSTAFLIIVAIIGIVGWPRSARLIRGVVLVAREREYVLAARSFGASDAYLMRKHVIPQTLRLVATQAPLLIPRYVLAEITLSFLGLGVNEPAVSWGLMLAALQQYHVLISYSWMFLPAVALAPTFYSYFALSELIRAE
jgi:peptide/nickel transport system permease protein